MSIQVKLLRVLEEKKIERVGDNVSIDVDVRIITATNRNLERLIKQKKFRQDLFFRINVFPVRCPPLSARLSDIPPIVQHLVHVNSKKTGKKILGFSPPAMARMMSYHWPGNVRELRNAVEYAFVLCNGSTIGLEHLPERVVFPADPGGQDPHKRDVQPSISPALSPANGRSELVHALKKSRGNQTRAAQFLGVSRVTVWKRIKKYGVDLEHDLA
jgi:DNA-binding NtrC family response regulator